MSQQVSFNTDADREMLLEMQVMLQSEISKPYSKRNYDLIRELTAAITDATVPKAEFEESVERGLNKLERVIQKQKVQRKNRILKPIAVAATCFVLLIGANAWSLHATGSSLFKLSYSVFSDFFSFRYSDSLISTDSMMDSGDPYGIRAECEKDGFSPLVPKYLPEGFELKKVSHNPFENKQEYKFCFYNNSQKIILDYFFYDEQEQAQESFSIPSDQHNIEEMECDDTTVVISKEDGQFTAFFIKDQTVHLLYTENIDYTDSKKILQSYFE